MTTARLCCTTNYGLFEPYAFNRDIRRDKHLFESMKIHGFDPGSPLNCRRNERNKLTIVQGHNRFEIAKELGLPVWYILTDSETPVDALERGNKPWSVRDYVTAFTREGREDYAIVLDYSKRTGIGLGAAMSMFGGQSAGSGNIVGNAKMGNFKIRNREIPMIVADLCEAIKRAGAKWAPSVLSVSALCHLVLTPSFDVERLKSKAAAHSYLLERQPTLDLMLSMYEAVYNRQAREADKVPIAFLAKQAAAQRNAVSARIEQASARKGGRK